MSDSEDRIHDATPARLQQAAAQGDIPKSHELATAASMFVIVLTGYLLFAPTAQWLTEWTKESWSLAPVDYLDAYQVSVRSRQLIFAALGSLAPSLMAILVITVLGHWAQTGPIWIPGLATPKPERLVPGSQMSNTTAASWLAKTLLGVPKVIIAASVMVAGLWGYHRELINLSAESTIGLVPSLFGWVNRIVLLVVATMLLMGVLDYVQQWFAHRDRLRMSEQEVREEIEQQEGDAVNRSRQRQLDRV